MTKRSSFKSARRDSNPRPQPWQGCTPPLSHSRTFLIFCKQHRCRLQVILYNRNQFLSTGFLKFSNFPEKLISRNLIHSFSAPVGAKRVPPAHSFSAPLRSVLNVCHRHTAPFDSGGLCAGEIFETGLSMILVPELLSEDLTADRSQAFRIALSTY